MKLVILSRRASLYSTRRLTQAARKRGHTVRVMNPLDFTMVLSTRNPELYYKGRKMDSVDAVIPRIGSSITFYGLAVVRQFEMIGTYCVNESNAIARSRDKLRALQLLSRADEIGVPATAIARRPDHARRMLAHVGGAPAIVKLIQGTQGAGVVIVDSKQSFDSVIDAFHAIGQNILIQSFVKEAKGTDIRALVVGRRVVAAMTRRAVEGEFRSNVHLGGSATRANLPPEYRKAAVAAAQRMGLGVAGVDMLASDEGPMIMEVNSSPGLEGIERSSGVDVADAIIAHIERNARPGRTRDKVGK
ncbi:MAG: 30S ribosomal protein S6--L-glutamate ligase [Euzebyales bacterium]|nr:30S ribosomal protein S6--L-glutamate ligase [Euzebyales bacterium]